MKTIIKGLLLIISLFTIFSCKDMDDLRTDPNEPTSVSTATLMTGAQKSMLDYIYDNWFSGRQALVYAQYWAQRTYTEEDRYQIRESVNNNYFNYLFRVAGNLVEIEKLNTDEATKTYMATFGDNDNQIAAAKVLKVWLMEVMVDTWGSIPYSEAFKLREGVYYPKYDDQTDLYYTFITELDEAIALFNTDEVVFTEGDEIYGSKDGDQALAWKKFANSLKCRIALRLSKVDSNWKKYIAEAVASGVFTSNDDNAVFNYSASAPNQCYFYKGFFEDGRNDFSITKPFVDLLKGQPDTLNTKSHPWEDVVDPRLPIYTTPRNGVYVGLPYGLASAQMTTAIRNAAPNFYTGEPLPVKPNFAISLMSYPEICFILSEYNGFSAAEYKKGVKASLEYWNNLNTSVMGKSVMTDSIMNDYVAKVSSKVNAETVATQKYIHLYMNGTEAWSEYRRTGYPTTLLKPGEHSYKVAGEVLDFSPLSDTKGDLPARVKYPTNESTLNPTGFSNAVAKLTDGTNNYYSKMFWDVRTTSNPHPVNK
ncbi:MAG: SusD/RagB family nutrient-binding outer membrane lipoprotein [Dysgonomonas sp.]|uniref:SusD/RagB family nutrient-binding outer membrane lipoprotein n=1 Tax=Dysgonomonas sp. TaxID=1891233 RepID=UPI0039E6CFE0